MMLLLIVRPLLCRYELVVKNTGPLLGDVVVTCYVLPPKQLHDVERPPAQLLFAFDRVEALEKGSTVRPALAPGFACTFSPLLVRGFSL